MSTDMKNNRKFNNNKRITISIFAALIFCLSIYTQTSSTLFGVSTISLISINCAVIIGICWRDSFFLSMEKGDSLWGTGKKKNK